MNKPVHINPLRNREQATRNPPIALDCSRVSLSRSEGFWLHVPYK